MPKLAIVLGLAACALPSTARTPRPGRPAVAGTRTCCARTCSCLLHRPAARPRTRPGRVLLRATSSIDNHGRGPLELTARRAEGIAGASTRRSTTAAACATCSAARSARLQARPRRALRLRQRRPGRVLEDQARGRIPALVARLPHAPRAPRPRRAEGRLLPARPRPHAAARRLPLEAATRAAAATPRSATTVSARRSGGRTSTRTYPEQWIDVTGLRGTFAFVQIADPDRLLIEASHATTSQRPTSGCPPAASWAGGSAVSRP